MDTGSIEKRIIICFRLRQIDILADQVSIAESMFGVDVFHHNLKPVETTCFSDLNLVGRLFQSSIDETREEKEKGLPRAQMRRLGPLLTPPPKLILSIRLKQQWFLKIVIIIIM
jgi:hypothetical protein